MIFSMCVCVCVCVFSSEAVLSYVSQSVSFSQNKGTWGKLHPSCSHVLMNEMLVKKKKTSTSTSFPSVPQSNLFDIYSEVQMTETTFEI